MILVLAGTQDGREIVQRLADNGYKVAATVVSDYGAELLSGGQVEILKGRLNQDQLVQLLKDREVEIVIDATHPYADKISRIAQTATAITGVQYLRYQRPASVLPPNSLVYRVNRYQEAATTAMSLGDVVFLTIGSKTLPLFIAEARSKSKRLIARVLPAEKIIQQCINDGLSSADIMAMQGPFSIKMNQAMLEHTGADVLVTKDSGHIGGTETKIAAAMAMNIPVVLIERPDMAGQIYASIDQLVLKVGEILTKVN